MWAPAMVLKAGTLRLIEDLQDVPESELCAKPEGLSSDVREIPF